LAKLFPGTSNDIIGQNVKALKAQGHSDAHATHLALKFAKKGKAADRAKKKVVAKPRKQKMQGDIIY
jgi:hypothetical protein